MRAIALLVALSALVAATELPSVSEQDAADWELFQTFQRDFGKLYGELEEKLHRFAIFQSNMRRSEELTRQHNGQAQFGVTRFSDMSPEEFAKQYLSGLNITAGLESMQSATKWEPSKLAAPVTVDWNAAGKVTPVRDQGQCGGCWAFSACEEIESQLVIKGWTTAPNIVLSRQQLIDCDTTNDHGCNGGFYTTAWNYMYAAKGIMQESHYTYKGVQGSCKYNAASSYNIKPKNGGYTTPGTSAASVYNFVASHGPASAALDATPLQNYQSGILSLSSSQCPSVNHAVLITGYDSNKGYYRVRNSWSAQWGEAGYFRISTTSCGISTLVYGSTCIQ